MGFINAIADWYQVKNTIQSNTDNMKYIQRERLHRLLNYAAGFSEFYQDLYRGIELADCSLQDLPIITKAAMMGNYDRLVTDKRLKLREIQKWTQNTQNDGKFYLDEYSPFLFSGSSGINALVTYHRKAVEVIQACLLANFLFQVNRSVYRQIQAMGCHLFGKRLRVALILVPRSNVYTFIKQIPRLSHLFIDLKIFSLFDPLDEIVAALNKFKPDQLISNSFF